MDDAVPEKVATPQPPPNDQNIAEMYDFPSYITTERVVVGEGENARISDSIHSDIVCPICSNVLIAPQDCITCDTSFCQACMEDYMARQGADPSCPLGCPHFKLKMAHKKVRQLLADLRIRCIFWPLCQETLPYAKLMVHERELCVHNRVKCGKCECWVRVQDRQRHEEKCQQADSATIEHQLLDVERVGCPLCQAEMSRRELLDSHFDTLGNPSFCVKLRSILGEVETQKTAVRDLREQLRVHDERLKQQRSQQIFSSGNQFPHGGHRAPPQVAAHGSGHGNYGVRFQ